MSAPVVNQNNYEKEVLGSNVPVLIDFYADWCGPCRMMTPIVDELAAEFEGRAKVVKVNVDQSPDLAARYQVQSIPTFLVIRDGEPSATLKGAQDKAALTEGVLGTANV